MNEETNAIHHQSAVDSGVDDEDDDDTNGSVFKQPPCNGNIKNVIMANGHHSGGKHSPLCPKASSNSSRSHLMFNSQGCQTESKGSKTRKSRCASDGDSPDKPTAESNKRRATKSWSRSRLRTLRRQGSNSLHSSLRSMRASQNGGGSAADASKPKKHVSLEAKRERKAAKTLAIVTGAFIACWLPFFILALLMAIFKEWQFDPVVISTFLWLGYFNSTLNPIIYTVFSPEFRQAFQRILFGKAANQNHRPRHLQ